MQLTLCRVGWHVFLVAPEPKHRLPHTAAKMRQQTRAYQSMVDALTEQQRSAACGTASGIHVVDVDLDEDKSGWESLKEFEAPR